MIAAAFAALFALPLLASATLEITQPTGAGWVGNTTVTVAWTWNNTDPTFSVELLNPNSLLIAGPIAVANNVIPNTNSVSFELPVLPAGSGYSIQLVNIGDINQVYATSPSFSISSNPTSSSVTGSNTAAGGPTKSGASATPTKTSSTIKSTTKSTASSLPLSTGSSTGNSTSATSTTTDSARTTLVISTSASASPSSSAKASSASALSVGGWASSAVAFGAVIVSALIVV